MTPERIVAVLAQTTLERKFSWDDVAQKTGVDTSTVAAWVDGETPLPLGALVDWAKMVGCEIWVHVHPAAPPPAAPHGPSFRGLHNAYIEVAAVLRGELGSYDGALPSENTLARRFDVGRPTVRAALKLLEGEDLIVPVQARGWFVAGAADRVPRDLVARLASLLPAPGERVGSTQQVADSLGCTRYTARQVLVVLKARGLVVSRPGTGAGWFATAPTTATV